jgi:hypothetical protein
MDDTEKLISGKAIILEIVRAMRANLEPLLFSTVAPSRYFVYLHPADHQRLEGIVPLIVEQARRALDEEVRTWNAQGQPGKFSLKRLTGDKTAPPIEPLAEGWDIRFEPDADGEMQPGDIAVASELVLPVRPEFEGSKTRRLTTLRRGDQTSSRQETVVAPAPPPPPLPQGTLYGTLAYEDRRGRQVVSIDKPQLVVGRGGVGYWVDVKIDASADVSREHLRLRRDESTGQFFLKDLSSLGTTVDGVPVPSSVEVVDGQKRDKGVEIPLPPKARITLANVVVIEFEARNVA